MAATNTGQEALSSEAFEIWDRTGKKPRKEAPVAQPEPISPKVKNLIPDGKIKPKDVIGAPSGRIKTVRNETGMMFTGYNVTFQLENGKVVTGWMEDGVYLELRRLLGFEDKVNVSGME